MDLPFRATGHNTISESPDECCRIVLVNHAVYRQVPVTSGVGYFRIEAIDCARRCDNHHTDPMDGRRGDGCDQEQRKSQEQAEQCQALAPLAQTSKNQAPLLTYKCTKFAFILRSPFLKANFILKGIRGNVL